MNRHPNRDSSLLISGAASFELYLKREPNEGLSLLVGGPASILIVFTIN